MENRETETETDGVRTDFVEGLQVTNGRGAGSVVGELILQVGNQHPKLGPPVSHMVQPEESHKQCQN